MGKILLLLKELRGNFFLNFILLIVVMISTLLSLVFIIVVLNFSNYIDKTFSKSISPDMIKVSPRPTSTPKITGLFGMKLKQPKGTYIDDDILYQIKKIKGVKEVSPLLASRIPMQVMVSIFGLNYGSDLICIGVDYNLIAQDLKDKNAIKLWNNWKEGNEIPTMIPEILFQAYNSSMAEPNNLPKVSKDMLIGVKLKLNVGKSSLKTLNGSSTENAYVAGFTDKVANICLVLPLRVMRYYNEKFNVRSEYIHLYVKVADHASMVSVTKKLKEMGLIVESDKTLSEEILKLKNFVSIIGNVFIIIVIFIASIAIAFGSVVAVSNRFEYYKILRILGSSKTYIVFSIIFKYALLGFLAGILAINLFDYAFKMIATKFSLVSYISITSLTKPMKNNIILLSTLIPAFFSLFGILKLYDQKELVID
ncbi:MAG: hypothetical protein ACP5Q5_03700 [Brevinematia bacterium]